MHTPVKRRDFLRGAGIALGSAASLALLRAHAFAAAGGSLTPPVVDRLSVRVVIDTTHDIFISGYPHPMVAIERTRNIEILNIDSAQVDRLILSHGHLDHYGGLVGFLGKYRERMRPDLKLFAGGETNFCYSYVKPPGKDQPVLFGVLDRRDIDKAKVETILCETPHLAGDAFTSGHIERTSFERVLPNTLVEPGQHDGAGCQADHFTAEERQGKIVADLHRDEHATCYVVKDRGLVVITSCGHTGFVNTVETARRVSGVDKLHALIGGVHLAPAPKDYVAQAVAELKKLDPDVVIPMHCSGANFIDAMRQQMPEKLVLSSIGSRFTFGA